LRFILLLYLWTSLNVGSCGVNLFAVSAVVLGKLTVSPAGPVVVNAGTTVTIDCASDEDERSRPDIRWFQLLSYSQSIKDVIARNLTAVPCGEGRIACKWTGHSVLQLVISSAVAQDTGTYMCVLDKSQYRSVGVHVIDLFGWHLLLYLLACCVTLPLVCSASNTWAGFYTCGFEIWMSSSFLSKMRNFVCKI